MKTIKKYGKITIIYMTTLALMVSVVIIAISPLRTAQSATYPAATISLPTYSGGVLLTNPYFILYDVRTGYLLDATTGVPATATAWVNAAFDSGHWTGGEVSTITGFPNLIIPALDSKGVYGIMMFDAASPANTDTCITKGLYNPRANLTYSDASPTKNNEVMTREFIE